ncbi:nitroreductase family deazaflavin-dependent oxidoreductase [Streptosporangium sp. NBC_01639]|uniref:nitroreductase family deazaflavin-dependent oxidoreductase n=1 Tax=unclassified Streptosporangium TaxID=2632669 RepID=UPI002DD7F06D|nr:nitroreductase family deazaflavin-dependent oxidoreductase [Streptosporangium sp. NBC_01756]WSC85373.1 nitroreductase family deazaflavin-dependent oxidoreductase [Streptosporangium sp. NBC_01756]WTD55991.1 nitroreductase family deazaflavin-dependent oxidoreductase [Streptosporangium sp. NBC_01639]
MTSSEGEFAAYNKPIIEEFRANKGIVGGAYKGLPLVLITTKGARSGRDRLSPVSYIQDGTRIAIAATNAGSDKHPAWYHNLVANPDLTVEIGDDKYEATAVEVKDEERDRLWAALVESNRRLGKYKAMTSREIPLFVVERKAG